MRALSRKNEALRKIELLTGVNKFADGSCLASFGDTRVLCTATIENKVPAFLRNSGTGWITAEYGMLPRSTESRMEREAVKGRQNGRSQEIQRMIGRSLRSVVDMGKMGERQIIVDCDVLQADGGTRMAAVTGGFIAMHLAMQKLKFKHRWDKLPIQDFVAGVSAGIVKGEIMLDLDFDEDSHAETDANFVMTGAGGIVEVQGTAEKIPFTDRELSRMMEMAGRGIIELISLQRKALNMGEQKKQDGTKEEGGADAE
ncbi:MAG: ribonuclease PH [Rickettsiales bacterium]|jgi:ribonuclease PH|nr:ribonuclease PH [Rickettsiales bacterium]